MEEGRRRYVFKNLNITDDLIAQKLETIERTVFPRGDADAKRAPKPERAETKKPAPTPLLSTTSSSRLEVPVPQDPRRRRPSTGSTSSSSSRPNSQEIDTSSSQEDISRDFREIQVAKEVQKEKDSAAKMRRSTSKDSFRTFLLGTPPITIVEQPEEGTEFSVVVEPSKQRRRTSLQSKRSSESDITIPLVFINSVESLRKSGSITAGRKALGRKNASKQSRMRRWKSDPGLGSATTESSQASFVVLKKSLSFGSAPKEALGKSLESLYDPQAK